MITTHFYLDTRAAKGGPAPLKLAIGKRSATAYLPTEFRLAPANWDAKAQRIVGLPRARQMNAALGRIKTEVEDYLRPLLYSGELADLTATEIKTLVDEHLNGSRLAGITLGELWDRMMSVKGKSSRATYDTARKRVEKAIPGLFERPAGKIREKDAAEVYETLKKDGMSMAYRNIAVCGLKVAYNDGKRAGIVDGNPFASIKTPYVKTRKRDLTAEQFRALWNAETLTEGEREALDAFRLSFLLRAMNAADIARITADAEFNGRIEYDRAKTGKHYSVRIEPEARELLDKYANKKTIFSPVLRYNSEVSMTSSWNSYLKEIAARIPGMPSVSMYWARHTFASLAFELGVSVDIVAAMLGHSVGARVTMGYVDIRDKQVDDAARKVYDYALYGKR